MNSSAERCSRPPRPGIGFENLAERQVRDESVPVHRARTVCHLVAEVATSKGERLLRSLDAICQASMPDHRSVG